MVSPQTRQRVRHALVRYRRPLAAGCAAAAVLITTATLRTAQASPTASSGEQHPPIAAAAMTDMIGDGLVASPVRLSDADVVTLLQPGSLVDVVAADGKGHAFVVADAVEVVTIPQVDQSGLGSAGFGGALVVVAVSTSDAIELAATSAVGPLSVVLVG